MPEKARCLRQNRPADVGSTFPLNTDLSCLDCSHFAPTIGAQHGFSFAAPLGNIGGPCQQGNQSNLPHAGCGRLLFIGNSASKLPVDHPASRERSDEHHAQHLPRAGHHHDPKSHGHSASYMAIVLGIVAILLDATAPASVSASYTAPGVVPSRTALIRSNRPGRVETTVGTLMFSAVRTAGLPTLASDRSASIEASIGTVRDPYQRNPCRATYFG